ncbi:hypothetical protein ACHAW5_005777 [Stephanodiscus triporus]|uniref:Mitochondrial carrier protein n=1 Tax=Stephanodiscus triporus TaxID=2934178 RepID=A0ABD3PU93_9STRA
MSPPHQHRDVRRRANIMGSPHRQLRALLTLLSFLSHVTSATPAASIASSIDYRYFVAGGTCAAISHGITTPIDVVKTRMQSNPDRYRTVHATAASIVREEGASALVAGLGPTLVGYGVEGALKFGVYEVTKPLVVRAFRELSGGSSGGGGGGRGAGPPGMLPFLIASIMAGAVASLVLVPMESTRIRMVTDPDFADVGLLEGLGRLVEEAGIARTLTVGMGAMLAKQVRLPRYQYVFSLSSSPFSRRRRISLLSLSSSSSSSKLLLGLFFPVFVVETPPASRQLQLTRRPNIPYTFGKQVSFDVVAKFLYRKLNVPTSALSSLTKGMRPEYVKWVVSVLAAMVASVMACLLSQPGDVILTETYDGAGGHGAGGGSHAAVKKQQTVRGGKRVAKSKGLREVSSTIYSRHGGEGVVHGVSGFFTGLQARFVHVGLIITSQLVIYDIVKQLLGLPASGSH